MGKAWRRGKGDGGKFGGKGYGSKGRPKRGISFKERDFGVRGGRRAKRRIRQSGFI